MKLSNLKVVVVAVAMALAGGLVLAQEEGAQPSPESEALEAAKQANLSPQQMLDASNKHLKQMREMLKRVVQLQATAKRNKDIIKLNCVNDKLLQVKQLMNIAENAHTNLGIAITRGDEDGRFHEFGRLTVARDQAAVQSNNAEQCLGESEPVFLGPTEVVPQGGEDLDDPTQPEDPITGTGTPQFPEVTPPPVASPYV